jgi:hypothetical protein
MSEELLLIQLFQLLDASKGNPINDRVIHAHHECRCSHKLTILVIDPVRCLSHRMGFGSKQLQQLTSGLSWIVKTQKSLKQ